MASSISGGSVVWDFDANSKGLDTALTSASSKVKNLGNEFKNSNKTIGEWTKSAGDDVNKFAGFMSGLATKVGIASIAAGAIGGVFLKSAADMDTTSKQFRILIGNTEVANDLFAQLADFAAKTPFEFPQIARAGKTLLGFGISSKDVFGHIKTLGDLAAATGADYERLALVFGQVNATGRLMGGDALQLINNNIPITTILAKKLGVSVQEVKKQMEDGKISAELFNDALTGVTKEGGFAFGGMETLAQSFTGRLSTLKDAVMEFGRNLLGVKVDPKLGLIVEPGGLFDKLTQALPKVTDALESLAPKFAKGFGFLVDNGGTLIAILGGMAAAFITLKVAVAGIAIFNFIAGVDKFFLLIRQGIPIMAAFNAVTAVNPISLIIIAIAAVIGALVFLQLRFKIFTKAWEGIKKAFSDTVDFFKDHAEGIKKILIGIGAFLLLPFLPFIALGVLIVKNFDTIKSVVVTAVTTIFNVITTVFSAIWNFVSPILKFFLDLHIIVWGSILLVILTVLNAIKTVIFAVWDFIFGVISKALSLIWSAITAYFNFYKGIVTTVLGAILSFVISVWDKIFAVISGVVKRILDFFAPAFNWLLQRGKDIINGLIAGIKSLYGAVSGAVKGAADKIGQFFSGAANWLFDTGKAIVQGLINGIKSMVGAVSNAAGNIGDAVKNKVRGLLGISSPSKVMAQYGMWTMEGFADGLQKGNSKIIDAIGTSISPVFEPTVMPSVGDLEIDRGPAPIINNIDSITIGSEVDGENWLKRLTRDEEVTSQGLTSYAV